MVGRLTARRWVYEGHIDADMRSLESIADLLSSGR
jgi:hypothetical protein